MIVDVSHGEEVFYDAIAVSPAPIIASPLERAGCHRSSRNMSDEMLRLMAENGGVVRLTVLSSIFATFPRTRSAMQRLRPCRPSWKRLGRNDDERAAAELRWRNQQAVPSLRKRKHVVDYIDHIGVKIMSVNHVGIGCTTSTAAAASTLRR